jgi:hypothetical protein
LLSKFNVLCRYTKGALETCCFVRYDDGDEVGLCRLNQVDP